MFLFLKFNFESNETTLNFSIPFFILESTPESNNKHIALKDLVNKGKPYVLAKELMKISFVFEIQFTMSLFLCPPSILFVFTRGASDFAN